MSRNREKASGARIEASTLRYASWGDHGPRLGDDSGTRTRVKTQKYVKGCVGLGSGLGIAYCARAAVLPALYCTLHCLGPYPPLHQGQVR
jgi:hypothetical protein